MPWGTGNALGIPWPLPERLEIPARSQGPR